MMQDRVDISTEKKVWEVPSLSTLQITQTFGGDGESEYTTGGPSSGG